MRHEQELRQKLVSMKSSVLMKVVLWWRSDYFTSTGSVIDKKNQTSLIARFRQNLSLLDRNQPICASIYGDAGILVMRNGRALMRAEISRLTRWLA